MSDDVRAIKIFSSVTMPAKAGKLFLEVLKDHRDADVVIYEVGAMADDMSEPAGTESGAQPADEEELEPVQELDSWLEGLGAERGESVIIHHGGFHFETGLSLEE